MNHPPTHSTSRFIEGLARRAAELRNAPRPQPAKLEKPPPPPTLVDQVRAVLLTMPESYRTRVSAELMLPSLKGKYRDRPSLRALGTALRALGYHPVRVWSGPDKQRRFWIAPGSN